MGRGGAGRWSRAEAFDEDAFDEGVLLMIGAFDEGAFHEGALFM